MRLFPLLNAILRGHLDADGKKITNLGDPADDGDAATKGYVDSHAGGSPEWSNIRNKPSTFPPSAHTHTKSQITDFPTAFTPSAHASTHAANGSDPITVAQSQVTGLASALAEKATLEDLGVHDMADDAHQELFDGKLNRADVISPSSAEVEGYAADAYETKNALAEKASTGALNAAVAGLERQLAEKVGEGLIVSSYSGSTTYHVGDIVRYYHVSQRWTKFLIARVDNADDPYFRLSDWEQADTASEAATVAARLLAPSATDRATWNAKVGSFAAVGGVTPTVTGGVADVSSLFSSANTANNLGNIRVSAADATTAKQYIDGNIRYDIAASSSATMADRTINQLTMAADTPLVFPAAVSGKARDFLLKLTYTSGEMTLPQGVTKVGDELTFTAGKTYLLAFTEIAANQFYIRAIDITTTEA